MKKSIGGKVAVILSFLAVLFMIAMALSIAALMAISDFNTDMSNFMEMQQYKGSISVAFQENKAVLDKVYFNDSGEEYENRKASVIAGMGVIEENLEALRVVCEREKNAEAIELYTTWDAALREFHTDVSDFFSKVDSSDFVNAKFLMDEFPGQEEAIIAAEDAFNTSIYDKQMSASSHATKRINGTIIFAIAETVAFFVIILVAMTIILRTVATPAKKTKKALDEIVSNIQNNEGDLTERVPVETVDEIGQMSEGINSFIEELQQIMQKLKEDSVSLMASAEMVEAKIEASNESANNVSATTEEMSASMEEISATLAQVAEGNASILVDVRSMSEKAAGGAQLVEEIKERAKGIYATTLEDKEKASSMMEEIRISLQQAVEESKSVERIRELTNEILSITNQTNLLSLNASIEAARAGEAGRGFAVVAGEISHLADNSRETANNIQNISELVTAAVEKLAQNAEYVLKFIDEKVMTDYDGFVDVASQYEKDADDMNSILQDFASNSSAINHTMLSLNEGIERVHSAMDENARGVTDVAQNVVGLVEAIAQIQQETETNVDISRKLGEEVQRFKNV